MAGAARGTLAMAVLGSRSGDAAGPAVGSPLPMAETGSPSGAPRLPVSGDRVAPVLLPGSGLGAPSWQSRAPGPPPTPGHEQREDQGQPRARPAAPTLGKITWGLRDTGSGLSS